MKRRACCSRCQSDKAADVAEALDPNTAAHILAKMDTVGPPASSPRWKRAEAAMVLEAMDPDDRVDILEPSPRRCTMNWSPRWTSMRRPRSSTSSSTRRDTAGGIMTTAGHRALPNTSPSTARSNCSAGSTKSSSRCSTSTWSTAAGTWSACCRCAT